MDESEWQPLERPPKHRPKTAARARPENVKALIVKQREFEYRPNHCDRPYRIVVTRKNLTVSRGEPELFDDIRYLPSSSAFTGVHKEAKSDDHVTLPTIVETSPYEGVSQGEKREEVRMVSPAGLEPAACGLGNRVPVLQVFGTLEVTSLHPRLMGIV